MNDVRLVGPFVAGIFALGLLSTLFNIVKQLWFTATTPPSDVAIRPFDASIMLPELRKLHWKLSAQGLHPLGIARVKLPFGDFTGTEWTYTNEAGTIWIEAIQVSPDEPAMVQYTTLFPDNAMILTRFPRGEWVETANYHSRFAAKDVNAAYEYHREMIKGWQSTHGAPRVVTSMEDVQAYDEIWRQTHRTRDYRALSLSYVVQLALGVPAVLLMALTGWIFWRDGFQNDLVLPIGFGAVILSGLSVGAFALIQNFRFRPDNGVDNRKAKPNYEYAE